MNAPLGARGRRPLLDPEHGIGVGRGGAFKCRSWRRGGGRFGMSRGPPLESAVNDEGPEQGHPSEGAGEGREAVRARLLEKARALPKSAGVYLMKDGSGRVIYVGKAARLPDRVSSYFVPSADLGYQKQRLL